MDHTRVMYRVKPIITMPEKIELPTCMYSMKKILDLNVDNARYDSNNKIFEVISDKKSLPELSELEARWDRVIDQLNDLVKEVNNIKEQVNTLRTADTTSYKYTVDECILENLKVLHGAVINVNPTKPPYSLFLIRSLCKDLIRFSSYVHSSVKHAPENISSFRGEENTQGSLHLKLIWKEGITDTELVFSPVKQLSIRGEVNILRYLGRMGLKLLQYPLGDIHLTLQVDTVLDICHRLQHTQAPKEMASLIRNLNAKLGRNKYLGGEQFNISDIALWSVLKQSNILQDLTPNMSKWFKMMDSSFK